MAKTINIVIIAIIEIREVKVEATIQGSTIGFL